jgi:nucleotide-binding universal stress UspA family protein
VAFHRILIAVDGSAGGEAATRIGGELAAGHDTEVLLVHAVPLPTVVVGVDQVISDETLTYFEETAESAVITSEKILGEMGVASQRVIRPGGAAHVILDVAEERDVDVIVVGHRGLGAVKRFMMGSVSSQLAHHARCAVLLAPIPE